MPQENQPYAGKPGTDQPSYGLVLANQSGAVLPIDANLLAPVKIDWTRMPNVHSSLKGISALEHVAWYYLAQGISAVVDSERWKEAAPSFKEYCSTVLGRKPEYVHRILGFYNWIERNVSQDFNVIPRSRIMGLIMIYSDAFLQQPGLIDLVFVQGCNDRETIMGAIRKLMGIGYLASKSPDYAKSKRQGGKFNPTDLTDTERSLALLLSRVEAVVVQEEGWKKLSPTARDALSGTLDNILRRIVSADTLPHLVQAYNGDGNGASVPQPVSSSDGLGSVVDAEYSVVNPDGAQAPDSTETIPLGETEREYLDSLSPNLILTETDILNITGKSPAEIDAWNLTFKRSGATPYIHLEQLILQIQDIGTVKKLEQLLRSRS